MLGWPLGVYMRRRDFIGASIPNTVIGRADEVIE